MAQEGWTCYLPGKDTHASDYDIMIIKVVYQETYTIRHQNSIEYTLNDSENSTDVENKGNNNDINEDDG